MISTPYLPACPPHGRRDQSRPGQKGTEPGPGRTARAGGGGGGVLAGDAGWRWVKRVKIIEQKDLL